MRSTRLARRVPAVLATLVATSAVLIGPAASAQAADGCGIRTTTLALAALGDTNSYFPLSGGTFESGDLSGFAVVGDPSVVPENEPWRVLGSTHTRSLALPPGAAVRATFCVGFGEDSLRLFTKSPGLPGSSLTIRTTVATTYGSTSTTSTTLDGSDAGWSLSRLIALPTVLALDGSQYVTVWFKNTGTGTWQVDDVLVDPWRTL
jgi:hypothetical protein